jgi:hypothetical protein
MKNATALIILTIALLTKCNESPKPEPIPETTEKEVDTVGGHCETVLDTRWNQPVRRFRVERPPE